MRCTTADAFFRGSDVIVPHDAVESLTDEDHEAGLRYLEATYAVKLLPTKKLASS